MKRKSGVINCGFVASMTTFMALSAITAVVMLCASVSVGGYAMEPVRPGQESFLIRAVFADQHLWLLSDAGVLSAIAENGNERVVQNLSGPVLDVCARDGDPVVVTGGRDLPWTLYRWADQKWSSTKTVPTDGDSFVSISCMGGTETILTSKRLIMADGSRAIHAVSLSGRLHHGRISASYDSGRYLFVGINAGEWGGGLARIDKDTGEIFSVEKNLTGQSCGGPLNSECDPVNGITGEPWNNNCLVVAVGLVHMMAHGRIVEVCGDAIRTVYTRPMESGFWASFSKGKTPPDETEAFFGLNSNGGTLWAVGTRGLYQIDRHGAATMSPLPRFRTIGGIEVSFDNPRVILVMTSTNERRSVSGSVPMLVPR